LELQLKIVVEIGNPATKIPVYDRENVFLADSGRDDAMPIV